MHNPWIQKPLQLLSVLVLGLSISGCGGQDDASTETTSTQAPAEPGPVVLIVVDTLRADHLPCYGYSRNTSPAICQLASEGALYERTYAPATTTTPAMASIFTGLNPYRHGVERLFRVLPEENVTLSERFQAAGWNTGGFVSSFVMFNQFSGFGQGFDVYSGEFSPGGGKPNLPVPGMGFIGHFERSASDTVEEALSWLKEVGPRSFLFIHLIEPHGPYKPLEPYAEKFSLPAEGELPGKVPAYQRIEGLEYASEWIGRYDGEIATADGQIKVLLKGLQRLGFYENATIVLTADHGESLGEEDRWFQHGQAILEAETEVPLVIKFGVIKFGATKFGKQAASVKPGVRVTQPVSLTDLHDSLLKLADIETVPDEARWQRDLHALASGDSSASDTVPPMSSFITREGQWLFAAHGQDCSFRWSLAPSSVDISESEPDIDPLLRFVIRSDDDAQNWQELVKPEIATAEEAEDPCVQSLARQVSPMVVHRLTHRRGFKVPERTIGPNMPALNKPSPPPPMPEGKPIQGELNLDEMERLRALGYVE